MASRRKLESARANGAKGGPKTPEGKARSSKNALKHGFCTGIVVLPKEDPAKFEELRQSILQQFPPEAGFPEAFITTIVNATWRLHRAWGLETTAIAEAVKKQTENCTQDSTQDQILYAAHRDLFEQSGYLSYLNRTESRFHREIRQTLQSILLFKKLQNKPNYPQTGECAKCGD